MDPVKSIRKLLRENERLRQRLDEAEQVIQGIRSGAVDALVVERPGGTSVYTLEGADRPYRVLVEAMSEGALILAADGSVLYCNSGFAKMVKAEKGRIIPNSLDSFASPVDRERLERLVKEGGRKSRMEELTLQATDGTVFPVLFSVVPLQLSGSAAICAVVTDLTEVMEARETRIRHSEELLDAHRQERRLIARELHDSTAQALATMVFTLEMALQSGEIGEANRKRLESVLALAKESADEIRDFSHLLHPPYLDVAGLCGAVRLCVGRFAEMTGIPVDLEMSPDLDGLPKNAEKALLRVVQEGLNNVFRHSRSPRAKVSLRRDSAGVVLQIADAGRGMKLHDAAVLPAKSGKRGIGISAMRERVENIGGRLEIESSDGGTVVRVKWPEPKPAPSRKKPQRVILPNLKSRAS
jgi:two-component system NarL family sensor kinase